jgi:DNA-binding SARP family transcriptional activator
MADEIWEYYARDAQRAIESLTEQLREETAERKRWQAVAERFYNLHPADIPGWQYAIVAYEDAEKKRDAD